jgi:pyruvate formate lyase activating enzyme
MAAQLFRSFSVKGLYAKSDAGTLLSKGRMRRGCTGSKGIIFDIKKYAVDDGPGIRTTIFFKGCPLRCVWCHNPESWDSNEEMSFQEEKCIGCARCVEPCPSGAISIVKGKAATQTDKCKLCGCCAALCPTGAKKLIGRQVGVDEIIEQIEKDVIFYDQSGGGVTFSGGEPLMQSDFLCELLEQCKGRRIHTAVDTSCYCQPEVLEKVSRIADMFLCDLKHTETDMHRRFTGVDNTVILENIKQLAAAGKSIMIRMPIIPGFNDSQSNIEATGRFAASLPSLIRIDILPYYSGGLAKSARLAKGAKQTKFSSPSDEQMKLIAEKLRKFGLVIKIGG